MLLQAPGPIPADLLIKVALNMNGNVHGAPWPNSTRFVGEIPLRNGWKLPLELSRPTPTYFLIQSSLKEAGTIPPDLLV